MNHIQWQVNVEVSAYLSIDRYVFIYILIKYKWIITIYIREERKVNLDFLKCCTELKWEKNEQVKVWVTENYAYFTENIFFNFLNWKRPEFFNGEIIFSWKWLEFVYFPKNVIFKGWSFN